MGIQFQQEDTVGICGAIAGCAPQAVSTNAIARQCVDGGTAGTGTPTFGTDAAGPFQVCLGWEMVPAAGDVWSAGVYTIPINVTTGNANLLWGLVFVCRINSACVNQATIGSLAIPVQIPMVTGVHSVQVTGLEQASPSAGDKVYVACIFKSNGGAVTVNFTPNQLISTPITAGSQTLCLPGRMVFGGLSNESTLFPRERPVGPENPLDVVIT